MDTLIALTYLHRGIYTYWIYLYFLLYDAEGNL